MEITNDQLKNYLGTGLIMVYSGYGEEKTLDKWSISIKENWDIHFMDEGQTDDDVLFYFKPICYRMKDLATYIPELGFIPAVELAKLITQAGWQGEVSEVKHENDTITVKFVHQGDTILNIIRQHCFEIDIDEDFGFGIYSVKRPVKFPKRWEESESSTGNIWKMYQKLFEWHFWPFGDEYFEKGLVIDKLKSTGSCQR